MSSASLVGVARGLALRACAVEVLLDLRVEQVLMSANRWWSGMKTATRRANKTAHAPNRKGGPGMTDFYGQRNYTLYNKRKSSQVQHLNVLNHLNWLSGMKKLLYYTLHASERD